MIFLNKISFRALLVLALTTTYSTAMGQKPVAVYYFQNSGLVLPSIHGADYVVEFLPPDTSVDKELLVVKSYYPDGKLKYISGTKSTQLNLFHSKLGAHLMVVLQGSYMSFFPNGHKMSLRSYDNGKQTGGEQDYYPNGTLHCIRTYTSDSTSVCDKCLDTQGQVIAENGNGKWLNYLDDDFKTYLLGNVINGLEQGEWEGKQGDSVKIKGIYKDGRLKVAYADRADKKVYIRLDTVPEFPGGLNGFAKYLVHNVHYPADARENNTRGQVIVRFIAEADGHLDELNIAKSVSKSIDEEALRVIGQCPKWKPGIVDGKPVCVAYSVPLNFTLSDN